MTPRRSAPRPSRRASYVLDASAAVKQFLEEPEQEALLAWLHRARSSDDSLLAPPLLRYELGNCMATQARLGAAWGPEDRNQLLQRALLGFRFADPDKVESHAPPLSYYDASYLALAKETASVLVTYDARLAEAAREQGIEVIAPGA